MAGASSGKQKKSMMSDVSGNRRGRATARPSRPILPTVIDPEDEAIESAVDPAKASILLVDDAPNGYEMFKKKHNECTKIVMKPREQAAPLLH